MKRVFLGWDRPGLTTAIEYLVERFGRPDALDLSGVVVAVPGGRVARRLLEILVHQADEHRWAFLPPLIVTIGHLPELLYPNRRPFAEELVQQLAWIEALKRSDPAKLKNLTPTLPAENDFSSWLALAEMIDRLHRELSAEMAGRIHLPPCPENTSFAEVVEKAREIPEFRDAPRWHALVEVQRKYLDTLNELDVWDKQTARRVAIGAREARLDAELILLGTVDMNRVQHLILDQISDRITALIVAPVELADRFDAYGCLRPEAWQEAPIPLADEQIEVAQRPTDQATAALRAIASWGGRYRGEEITIGVPDPAIVPYLQQHLEQAEVPARYSGGTPVARSGPCRLLGAVSEYLEGRLFFAFAGLVRHPAIQNWLAAQRINGDWLSELDDYYCLHLPHAVEETWLGPEEECGLITQVHAAIEGLLKPLAGSKRALDKWSQALVDLLVAVFGGEPLDRTAEPDRTNLEVCEAIHQVLEGHRRIPRALMPSVTGGEAVRLTLREVFGGMIPPLACRGAIELLGWLELPLDDAPALVVTGFNEGIVPGSLVADLFLPNNLRLQLGIEDNDRRYARDAYALSVLAASREELKLIVGRRTAEGDPLAPSRLLFACDEETIARRALALFGGEGGKHDDPFPGKLRPGRRKSKFAIPEPRPLSRPVTSMRVTEFRDYLACPYRYYLRHRLRLEPRLDAGEELDGGSFGSLAHAVLGEFGQCEAAGSTDSQQIQAHLNHLLDEQVQQWHGKSPLSAIRVQVEQLRLRLAAFARWQAQWAGLGWRIRHVEIGAAEREAPFIVDGRPMLLRGRIDRIDVNERSGELVIFDYKTSDNPKAPDRAHRKKDQWVDLQLPLYRHLAAGLGIKGPARLGYVILPKDTSNTRELIADWDDKILQDADRTAAEVVRGIWAEEFWPPTEPAPAMFEEFSAICLEDQFGEAARMAAGEDAQ